MRNSAIAMVVLLILGVSNCSFKALAQNSDPAPWVRRIATRHVIQKPPVEPASHSDPVALENYRDRLYALVQNKASIEDFIDVLTKISQARRPEIATSGIEFRIDVLSSIRVKSVQDIELLRRLLKVQHSANRRAAENIQRLAKEVAAVRCRTAKEHEEKAEVLVWLSGSPAVTESVASFGQISGLAAEECFRLRPRSSKLEEDLLQRWTIFTSLNGGKQVPNCELYNQLLLRKFAAARKEKLLVSDFNINPALIMFCSLPPSKIVETAREIFQVQKEVAFQDQHGRGSMDDLQRRTALSYDAISFAWICFKAEAYQDAEKTLKESLPYVRQSHSLGPDQSATLFLDRILMQQGKLAEAKEHLSQLLSRKFDQVAEAKILLAQILIRENNFPAAEKLLLEALEILGSKNNHEWRLPGAHEAIEELSSISKEKDEQSRSELLQKLATLKQELALVEEKGNEYAVDQNVKSAFYCDYPSADKVAGTFIERISKSAASQDVRVGRFNDFAKQCLDSERVIPARRAVSEALQLIEGMDNTSNANLFRASALVNRARISAFEGNFSEARNDLEQALQLSKSEADVYWSIKVEAGKLLLAEGKFAEAEKALIESCGKVEKTPVSSDAYTSGLESLAYAQFRLGKLEEAKGNFDQAIKSRKSDSAQLLASKPKSFIALINSKQGNRQFASKHLQDALDFADIAPTQNLAWTLLNVGLIAESEGNKTRARRHYSEAHTAIKDMRLKSGTLFDEVKSSVERTKA